MTRVAGPQASKTTGRVLLYVRTEEDISILQDLLAGMGAEGVICTDNEDLCRRLAQEDADAMLLTERMLADSALPSLVETLRNQPPWSDVPVLFVAGGGLDSPLAAQAMRQLPNVLVLDRPVRTATLTSALRMALRIREKQRQVRDLLLEREDREQALHEAKERLHLAMESGRVGVWEWQVGTDDMEWSQGVYTLLGYRPDEVRPSQEALRQRIDPRDLARRDEALKDALERREDYICEFRVVWADGSVHWVETRGQHVYLHGESGVILRMRGVLSDIDSRKQAEEALRERMKELGCLYAVSRDVQEALSVDELCQRAVERLVSAMQFPESAAVVLELNGKRFTSGNSAGGPSHALHAPIRAADEVLGNLRVYCTQERPFLIPEEQNLVNGVAETLSLWLVRQQAEEAVRRSEEKFHRLFEDDLTGNLITTPEGQIRLCNPAFATMFGFPSAQEAVGTNILALYPDPREREPLVERLKHEGKIERLEVWRKRRDGEPIHLVENLVGHFDEQGRLYEIKAYFFDDTERKQAEEALRESESFYRQTLESIPGMVFTTRPDGYCDYQSRPWADYTGVPMSEQLGDGWNKLLHPEDRPRAFAAWRDAVEGRGPYELEYRVRRRDGQYEWFRVIGRPIRDENGQIVRWFGVAVNIELLKRAEEALRASEHRYRKLFEANLAGVYLTKPDGTIFDFNDAMMRMLGYDSREEVFQHRSTDFYADPEFRQELVRLLQKDGVVPGREAVLQRKDGSVLYALGSAVVLRDEQTGEPYIQGVAIDITKRKRAEEALRELNATLESKVAERTAQLRHRTRQLQKLTLEMSEAEDRERERLAHILHDDLQQQLAAAKFHLGLVRSRIKADPSLQAITATVDEMLKDAIGKSRSLSHELSPGVLHGDDFAEIFHWLAGEMQAKHGLTVHVQGRAQAQSDPVKAFLYRTAQELLFNTVKHAQVQEARVRVRQCGGYICLSISDRGRGFDPEGLGETAGFGLLSIRERIELLGGRMKIRSTPGRGSTFFVVVPDRLRTADLAGVGLRAYPSQGGHGGPPLRVLLADDHQVVREGLISLLSEEGTIEVIGEATNGQEAVDLAERLHPDVVIMDVSMPVMDGEEATRRIKQDLTGIRIVSLSMWEDPKVREKMSEAGAESCILKTAPYRELLAAIRGEGVKQEAIVGSP